MKKQEPLTESYFYILLCLYKGPNHGYGIMQDTKEISNNRVKLGSGTLYTAISKMIEKDWIEESKIKSEEDERRKNYQITDLGKEVLFKEVDRIKSLLKDSKSILV